MAYTIANVYNTHSRSAQRTTLSPAALFGRIIDRLLTWQERAKGRAELGRLNDRMLKDIGISRVDALRETAKPFWKR